MRVYSSIYYHKKRLFSFSTNYLKMQDKMAMVRITNLNNYRKNNHKKLFKVYPYLTGSVPSLWVKKSSPGGKHRAFRLSPRPSRGEGQGEG